LSTFCNFSVFSGVTSVVGARSTGTDSTAAMISRRCFQWPTRGEKQKLAKDRGQEVLTRHKVVRLQTGGDEEE
jgi:hypothetical protein